MKMLIIVLIGSMLLLVSLPVAAQHGPEQIPAVFIMNADGSGQRPLFPYPIDARSLDISPDGVRIAYSTPGRLGFDVWVSDFDGSNPVNLTNTSGISESGPTWSPDGSRIAFTSNSEGNAEVFVMDADGQNVSNLTNHPAGDGGPVWSPDGNRFAFTSDREGTLHIHLMNTDGSGIEKVTHNILENALYSNAAWSPDGSRIAYVAIVGLERHIYLLNVTGEPPQPLVTAPFSAQHPAWSPDGTRIAFSWYREGITDIFVMNPGGQEVVNLTRGVGTNSFPTWTPDGRIVFATVRSPEELEGHSLGSDTVLTILEEGGLSFTRRSGNTPPVRLQRTNAAGEIEYIPLNRAEAERILRQRGDTRVKLDKLFEP